MLTLMLILLVTGVTLAVFLYVGSLFLQGYFYTEPSDQLYWQAPAAGGVLMLFFTLWCVLIANTKGATPLNNPYDALHRFNPRVDLLNKPAPEIWAVNKDGDKKPYKPKPETKFGRTIYRYKDAADANWRNTGIVNIEMIIDGEKYVFNYVKGKDGSYGEYVNDQGWAMTDYEDGPTGIPSIFRWGRFWLTIFLNLVHFLAWWLCLWLLLRFQWSHALGIGFALWLVFTLSILPMLLGYAAEVAQKANG